VECDIDICSSFLKMRHIIETFINIFVKFKIKLNFSVSLSICFYQSSFPLSWSVLFKFCRERNLRINLDHKSNVQNEAGTLNCWSKYWMTYTSITVGANLRTNWNRSVRCVYIFKVGDLLMLTMNQCWIWGSHSNKFWDIMTSNQLEIHRSFGELVASSFRFEQSLFGVRPASCWLLPWFNLRYWRWRQHGFRNVGCTSKGLPGVTSKKIDLFIWLWIGTFSRPFSPGKP
jgi:hypothetical protein